MRNLIHGGWQAEVLRAVLRLDLPDLLGDRRRSVADLAGASGADEEALARLLRLAAALGLFRQLDADYYTNNAASSLLRADHPRSMRVEAMHALSGWTRIAWDQVAFSVRSGTSGFQAATGVSVFEFLRSEPDEAAAFHAFQARVTRRNAAALGAGYPFPAAGTVLDVGGGSGALLAEVLRRRPGLRGVLYDRPEVVEAARGALAGSGVAARLDLCGGDFFEEVPTGADRYVLSHVLHDWADQQAADILGNVAAAMDRTAELLVVENVKPERGTSVLLGYLDVLMLAAWGSRERTYPEYEALLARAGLRPVGCLTLEPRTGLSAIIARRGQQD